MSQLNYKNKNFLLVMNFAAGKGISKLKKLLIIKALRKYKCSFEIISLDKLSKVEDFNIYDAVVAVGGDGTVLKIIPYLANTDVKLGVIPCGTANLFAASLCIPDNIDKAIDILINGSTAKTDIGKAGNEYFALRIGVGFDADVVNGASRLWKNKIGYLAYFVQGIISSLKLSQKFYKITIDNKTMEVNANSIIVANAGNMFKNTFTIAPSGSINDGKLDIFILLTKNIWEFLSVFARILLGRHISGNKAIYGKAKNIRIETKSKNIHMDGEPYSGSNLDICVIPNALSVVVP